MRRHSAKDHEVNFNNFCLTRNVAHYQTFPDATSWKRTMTWSRESRCWKAIWTTRTTTTTRKRRRRSQSTARAQGGADRGKAHFNSECRNKWPCFYDTPCLLRFRSRSRDRRRRRSRSRSRSPGRSSSRRQRSRSRERRDRGDRHHDRHRDRDRDRSERSDRDRGSRGGGGSSNKDDMSVEETNKLRASLGLAPLK